MINLIQQHNIKAAGVRILGMLIVLILLLMAMLLSVINCRYHSIRSNMVVQHTQLQWLQSLAKKQNHTMSFDQLNQRILRFNHKVMYFRWLKLYLQYMVLPQDQASYQMSYQSDANQVSSQWKVLLDNKANVASYVSWLNQSHLFDHVSVEAMDQIQGSGFQLHVSGAYHVL